MHGLAHPDGELATSRAAAKMGVCMGLWSYATESLENVAAQGNGDSYAMQLCILRDRPTMLQILERAEGRWLPGEAKLYFLVHLCFPLADLWEMG